MTARHPTARAAVADTTGRGAPAGSTGRAAVSGTTDRAAPTGSPGRGVATGSGRRRAAMAGVLLLTAFVAAGCDDQIKHVEERTGLFNTMSWQRSVEAFEEPARTPVPGTMPIDGQRTYDLLAADSLLTNPRAAALAASGGMGTEADAARGAELFTQFCTPCHGSSGEGDGAVVGPNRIPDIPFLNIRGRLTRGYTDGYIWGLITNGRGLMPSYRRIPADDRWLLVDHVRRLQAEEMAAEAAATTAAGTAASDASALDLAGVADDPVTDDASRLVATGAQAADATARDTGGGR